MLYTETLTTKLTPELAAKVRAHAKEIEVGESAVVRLAVKEFFKKPRVMRERVRVPSKPRASEIV